MKKDKSPLLTVTEYARRRGLKKHSVQYAVEQGLLKHSVSRNEKNRVMIDPNVADKEWEPRASNRNSEREKEESFKPEWAEKVPELELPPLPEEKLNDDGTINVPLIGVSRAKREHFEAELARLKVEKEKGRLVDAEEVKSSAMKVARLVRDALLNIPDRVSSELSAETDQFKIHKRLTEEIRNCLEGLKDAQ